jgi:hypothetical protein
MGDETQRLGLDNRTTEKSGKKNRNFKCPTVGLSVCQLMGSAEGQVTGELQRKASCSLPQQEQGLASVSSFSPPSDVAQRAER